MTPGLHDLVSGATTHLPLSKGIVLRMLNAGAQRGLALQINREALQARQVQRALERRFEQALAYDGCFVFSTADDALVLWHNIDPAGTAPEGVLDRLLSLAGLDHG
ncbi:transcriptional regulator [Pseudomonas kairouanensis]|uniref:Transcriptional regulator n=1 Tax=Pseudomonas kairouanensis TaxID=2293832 RepID=A0A4Z0AJZ9_9PSED|nr:transcriptional regulator [Pseudomonas kairouanensis]TFY86935.1 transcriptional regulator [Pseudomonas kairouanensis]